MVTNRRNIGRLKISNDVLDDMEKYRKKTLQVQKEQCGVMLGREVIDTDDIIIDYITGPSKGDIQKKFYFFRAKRFHQKIIEDVWNISNGTCNYLGEWHTHLEDIPLPSQTDIREWRKALKRFTYEGNQLFFIIIGLKEIGIWEGNKIDLTIKKIY